MENPTQSPILLPYKGKSPRIDASAWIAPGAVITGDTVLGPQSSVWFGTVIRGDVHYIRIGARTNIQDLTLIHVTSDEFPTEIGDDVTIAHKVTLHGCRVHDGVLVGMGAIVLDGAEIGEQALVGAGSLVTPGTKIPPRMLALGAPARPVRELTEKELAQQKIINQRYLEVLKAYRDPVR